jgi:STE24 endopeptidase
MNLLLSSIMYLPMIFLVGWAGPDAWWYLWAFLSAFVFVFNIIYPVVIAPLFNKFTPLQDQAPKHLTAVRERACPPAACCAVRCGAVRP